MTSIICGGSIACFALFILLPLYAISRTTSKSVLKWDEDLRTTAQYQQKLFCWRYDWSQRSGLGLMLCIAAMWGACIVSFLSPTIAPVLGLIISVTTGLAASAVMRYVTKPKLSSSLIETPHDLVDLHLRTLYDARQNGYQDYEGRDDVKTAIMAHHDQVIGERHQEQLKKIRARLDAMEETRHYGREECLILLAELEALRSQYFTLPEALKPLEDEVRSCLAIAHDGGVTEQLVVLKTAYDRARVELRRG